MKLSEICYIVPQHIVNISIPPQRVISFSLEKRPYAAIKEKDCYFIIFSDQPLITKSLPLSLAKKYEKWGLIHILTEDEYEISKIL